MSTMDISQTTQYKIKDMSLITNYGNLDLRNIFVELNIFDHILQPCMSGTILVKDAVGLSSILKFDGSEYIKIDISKDSDELRINKMFHIYKQTDKSSQNLNSESYILYFVSDEFVYSQQQTLNNYVQGTYSDMAEYVLSKKLKLESSDYVVGNSFGVRKIVVPNLSPFETLIWCSKRAINDKNLSNFLFFENSYRYNFVSLTDLKNQDTVMDILFEPKNINREVSREFFGARDYEIISQFDYLDSIVSGVYSGTFIGFDPLTRVIVQQNISFDDMFKDKSMNKNYTPSQDTNKDGKFNTEMIGSRRVVYPTPIQRKNSTYIKNNDPSSLNLDETPQYFSYQRRALLTHLFSKRMKVALPGNFLLSSGLNVNLKKQKTSTYDPEDTKDKTLYGKYLIVATRHIISNNKHDTIIEVVTDSVEDTPGKLK